jgi:hypothetical protein
VRRGEAVTVVANLGTGEQPWPAGHRHLALASDQDVRVDMGRAVLPVDTVAIFTENR